MQNRSLLTKPTTPYEFGPSNPRSHFNFLSPPVVLSSKEVLSSDTAVNRVTESLSSEWPRSSRTSGTSRALRSPRSSQGRTGVSLPDYTSETDDAPPIYSPSDMQMHNLSPEDTKNSRYSDALSSSVPSFISDSQNPFDDPFNSVDPFARHISTSLTNFNST
jgi:hypothetical protein